MVEAISARAIGTDAKVTRVTAAKPVASVGASAVPEGDTTAPSPNGDITALSGVARSLASTPPVDTDRVALVRRAIERGDFPILPATIADRMIALKYDWMNADDQA